MRTHEHFILFFFVEFNIYQSYVEKYTFLTKLILNDITLCYDAQR